MGEHASIGLSNSSLWTRSTEWVHTLWDHIPWGWRSIGALTLFWLVLSFAAMQGKPKNYGKPGEKIAGNVKDILRDASRLHREGKHKEARSVLRAVLRIAPAKALEDHTGYPVRKLLRSVRRAMKRDAAQRRAEDGKMRVEARRKKNNIITSL